MHATHLFLSSQLRNTLKYRPHIDISDLDPLVALYLKLITDDLGWPLNRQRLLRTALAIGRPSTNDRLAILLRHLIILAEEVKLGRSSGLCSACTGIGISRSTLLQRLVYLDGRHQLPLREQRVHLLHEFQGRVLLVQDQRVDVVYDYWDPTLLEEELQLLPVIALLCIRFRVVEGVHLNLLREVAGEYLRHKETVIECPVKINIFVSCQ